jgi:hypothetical protein
MSLEETVKIIMSPQAGIMVLILLQADIITDEHNPAGSERGL